MDIKIRVGAAADSSLTTVFQDFGRAARKARDQVQREFGNVGDDVAKPVKRGTDQAEKEFAKLAREADKYRKQMVRDAEKAIREEQRTAEKAKADEFRAFEKAEKDKTRVAEREARERQRAEAQAAKINDRNRRTAIRSMDQRNESAFRGVARASSFALHGGARIAGDVLRGAGINTDLSSHFQANVDLEKRATELSNSGYMPGDERNGGRVDPRELMAEVRKTATGAGLSAESGMEGLQSFVGLTGDLQTGRDILKEMAVLSRATGTEFKDMVSAAGEISNGLGDVENKGQAIDTVMKAMAGMGKLGAVEIKDAAKSAAAIASQAGQIEGDQAQNIITLSAFAQEARAGGGAKSATQAFQSAKSMIDTFKTPARSHAFQEATGKSVYNAQGMIRDPRELLKEALTATKGDPEAFKKIFGNVQGERAVAGFATIFRKAGGGQAGIEAVDKEFARLANAAMKNSEIQESFARSMNTTEAQTNILNNKLQESAQQMQDALIPAMVALAPAVLAGVQAFADLIGLVTGQKAKLEGDAARKGNAGLLDDTVTLGRGVQSGKVSRSDITQAEKDLAEQDEKIKRQEEVVKKGGASTAGKLALRSMDYSPLGAVLNATGVFGTKSVGKDLGNAREDKHAQDERLLEAMKEQRKEAADMLNHIKSGVLKVEIVNGSASKPPPVNPDAKTKPGPTEGD